MSTKSLVEQGVATDPAGVNRPAHYLSHPSAIEAIEICRHMSFDLGNSMKYLFRLEEKDGPLKNAKKALWYVVDEQDNLNPIATIEKPEDLEIKNPLVRDVLAAEPNKAVKMAMRYVYLADLTRDLYYFQQARVYLARIIAFHGGK